MTQPTRLKIRHRFISYPHLDPGYFWIVDFGAEHGFQKMFPSSTPLAVVIQKIIMGDYSLNHGNWISRDFSDTPELPNAVGTGSRLSW